MTTFYKVPNGLSVDCPEKGYIELTDENNMTMSYFFNKNSDHIYINLNMLGFVEIKPNDKLNVNAAIFGIFEQWSKFAKNYPRWQVSGYFSIDDYSQQVYVKNGYRIWFEAKVELTDDKHNKTTRFLVIKSLVD